MAVVFPARFAVDQGVDEAGFIADPRVVIVLGSKAAMTTTTTTTTAPKVLILRMPRTVLGSGSILIERCKRPSRCYIPRFIRGRRIREPRKR